MKGTRATRVATLIDQTDCLVHLSHNGISAGDSLLHSLRLRNSRTDSQVLLSASTTR